MSALTAEQEKQAAKGKEIAELLSLKPSRDHADRYDTTGGDKTDLGLFLTIKRIIEDEERKKTGSNYYREALNEFMFFSGDAGFKLKLRSEKAGTKWFDLNLESIEEIESTLNAIKTTLKEV